MEDLEADAHVCNAPLLGRETVRPDYRVPCRQGPRVCSRGSGSILPT